MDQEKILKLFKRYAGEVIDLHGLKCIPVGVGEFGTPHKSIKPFYPIQFKIENPNDVSYFFSVVEDELFDIVEEFGEIINFKLEAELLLEGKPKFYLNDEVRGKTQKVFDSTREIKFTTGTPFIGYKRWTIQIESVGLKPAYFDNDAYYIVNTVLPITASKNGENIDIMVAIDAYTEEYLPSQETSYETEKYYIDVDGILSQYPLLFSNNVATYYDTKFIM
jgi:hypothetical protein